MKRTSALLILILLIIGCENNESKHVEDDSWVEVIRISKKIHLDSDIEKYIGVKNGDYLICRYAYSHDSENTYDAFTIKEVMFVIKDKSKLKTNIDIKLPSNEVNAYFRKFTAWFSMSPELMNGEIILKQFSDSLIEVSIVDSLHTKFWQESLYGNESSKHSISFSGNHIFKR